MQRGIFQARVSDLGSALRWLRLDGRRERPARGSRSESLVLRAGGLAGVACGSLRVPQVGLVSSVTSACSD